MNNTDLNKAAEKFVSIWLFPKFDKIEFNKYKAMFNQTVKSDIAKQYWYAKWQLEQKQVGTGVWVKASERLPDSEVEVFWKLYDIEGNISDTGFDNFDEYDSENMKLSRIFWLDERIK